MRYFVKLAVFHTFPFLAFLQGVSIACYAERCIAMIHSVRLSDRLSHAGIIMPKRLQLRSCGLHWRIEPYHSSFLTVNFAAKFQKEHREGARAPNKRGVGKIGNF